MADAYDTPGAGPTVHIITHDTIEEAARLVASATGELLGARTQLDAPRAWTLAEDTSLSAAVRELDALCAVSRHVFDGHRAALAGGQHGRWGVPAHCWLLERTLLLLEAAEHMVATPAADDLPCRPLTDMCLGLRLFAEKATQATYRIALPGDAAPPASVFCLATNVMQLTRWAAHASTFQPARPREPFAHVVVDGAHVDRITEAVRALSGRCYALFEYWEVPARVRVRELAAACVSRELPVPGQGDVPDGYVHLYIALSVRRLLHDNQRMLRNESKAWGRLFNACELLPRMTGARDALRGHGGVGDGAEFHAVADQELKFACLDELAKARERLSVGDNGDDVQADTPARRRQRAAFTLAGGTVLDNEYLPEGSRRSATGALVKLSRLLADAGLVRLDSVAESTAAAAAGAGAGE